jgi:hypothetical protein
VREKPRDSQPAENFAEIATDELREFLEADLTGATIDPKFKEELRQTLWDFVRGRTDCLDSDVDGS